LARNPLALGTVGGLTSLASIGKIISRNAGKTICQRINAVCSCSSGFAKLCCFTSLTTTGIQEGHMKMHLNNIINQFEATDAERLMIQKHFKKNPVTHNAVVTYIESLRK
jgi:hydroxymethylglutaryl-CoA reductase